MRRWRSTSRAMEAAAGEAAGEAVPIGESTSLIIRPNGNGSVQNWSASDYTGIDDEITQPTSVGFVGSCSNSTEDSICEWTCEDIPTVAAGTVTSMRMWCFTSNDDTQKANIRIDGTWQTQNVTKDGGVGEWDYFDFADTSSMASGISGMEIRMLGAANEDHDVQCAYIEVFYDY